MTKQYYHNGIDFPSIEEMLFYMWCEEAKKAGIIWEFWHNSERDLTINIMPAAKLNTVKQQGKKQVSKEVHLLNDLNYTPDFLIWFADNLIWCDINEMDYELVKAAKFYACHGEVLVDVKGGFSGRKNNSAQTFPIIQKVLWNDQREYINKIIPDKLFKSTFAPEQYFWTDGGKDRVQGGKLVNDTFKRIGEYLNK